MPRRKKSINANETETKTAVDTAKPAASKDADTAAQASASKTAGRAAKKTELIQETYFELDGSQIMAEDIVAKIKEAYKAEGHRVGAIKSLKTYINPYERKAYYVINGKAENRFIEF